MAFVMPVFWLLSTTGNYYSDFRMRQVHLF